MNETRIPFSIIFIRYYYLLLFIFPKIKTRKKSSTGNIFNVYFVFCMTVSFPFSLRSRNDVENRNSWFHETWNYTYIALTIFGAVFFPLSFVVSLFFVDFLSIKWKHLPCANVGCWATKRTFVQWNHSTTIWICLNVIGNILCLVVAIFWRLLLSLSIFPQHSHESYPYLEISYKTIYPLQCLHS